MKVAPRRWFLVVVVLLSMDLVGCTMAFTPTKKYLFHPKPLVEAEKAVEQARATGKDRQCPAEFNSAQDLVSVAYQVYWNCKDDEAIRTAERAIAQAKTLCPPAPTPIAEVKPEVKPEAPTPLTPPPPAPTPGPKKPEIPTPPSAPEPKKIVEETYLADIHFEFDRSSLTAEAEKILEKNIRVLQENPEIKVRIEGHACSHGTDEYNIVLSKRRVKSVTEYFAKNGIAADQLAAYGETKPVMPEEPTPYNKESEAMRANRRVHFKITR